MSTSFRAAHFGRVLAIAGAVLAAIVPATAADAAGVTAGGFTTGARVASASLPAGATTTITVGVTASTDRSALVDVEIYDGAGRKVAQRFWDAQRFSAGVVGTYSL